MRRCLVALTALGLLSAVVGCQHTAGVCDCSNGGDHMYGTPVSALASEETGVQVTSDEGTEPPIIDRTSASEGQVVIEGQ